MLISIVANIGCFIKMSEKIIFQRLTVRLCGEENGSTFKGWNNNNGETEYLTAENVQTEVTTLVTKNPETAIIEIGCETKKF